jgi:hypothetical protein
VLYYKFGKFLLLTRNIFTRINCNTKISRFTDYGRKPRYGHSLSGLYYVNQHLVPSLGIVAQLWCGFTHTCLVSMDTTGPRYITVEPCLTDTPEKRTSTIMRTPCLVRNAISIDLHTIRTPEKRPPRYSVKRTLALAPTESLPIQTHPHSGHFGKKIHRLACKTNSKER